MTERAEYVSSVYAPMSLEDSDTGLEGSGDQDMTIGKSLFEQQGPIKKTLKEVVIPPQNPKQIVTRVGRILPSQSPSSGGSELSSIRDQASEYDTPGTSIVVTPAESLSAFSKKASKGKSVEYINKTSFVNKRKRQELDGDALLAQTLQEEEYQENRRQMGPNNKRQRASIQISDDDDELGFDNTTEDIEPIPRNKGAGRLSLPTRAARNNAKISIQEKASREIAETESSESELSDYISDVDSEDPDDFASGDEDLPGSSMINAANTATPTGNPIPGSQNCTATSRRNRRNVQDPRRRQVRYGRSRGGIPRVNLLILFYGTESNVF